MSFNFVQSRPGDDPIIVESFFAAPPTKVFRAWTEPEAVMKWFGYEPNSLHSASIDLRLGGTWQFLISKNTEKTVGFEGEYLDIKTGERIVFSWSHVVAHTNGQREESPASKVEITFTAKGAGTDVRLVHSAIATEDARKGVGGGWQVAFGSLQTLLVDFD